MTYKVSTVAAAITIQPWERRGAAIYEEGDGTPGNALCIAELHPASPDLVQTVVDAHNASFPADLLAGHESIGSAMDRVERDTMAASLAHVLSPTFVRTRMELWIVTTTVPGEAQPTIPSPFGFQAEAEAYADEMMRNEWAANGPHDADTDELLPYPGDWRTAQDAIVDHRTGEIGELWGRWEITCHEIEVARQSPLDLTAVLRNARGAIGSLMQEIEQMKGMFNDEDGNTEEALLSGEEADAEIAAALADLKDALAGSPAPLGLRATLKAGRDAIAEAMEVHIYDADNGDEPEPDCRYTAAIKQMDAALAGAGIGKIAVILDGGLVQSVVSDGAAVGLDVLVIDYDTEGADEDDLTDVQQGDGSVAAAAVSSNQITKAAITLP